MLRRIFNILTIASLIFFTALAMWAIPSFFDPKFEIVNNSTESVFVVAEWRNESKEVGSIEPMSSYIFSIDAEAAMKFRVIYADGRQADSEQIYFTRGTKVLATISDVSVVVRYDHETK